MSVKQKKKCKHSNLLALSPIEYRHNDPDDRVANIREFLAEHNDLNHEDHVLSQCPMLHMARLQIIDDVLPPIGELPADSLKTTYLLFVADIDGEIDDFLDALHNGPQRPFSWAKGDADSKKHSDFVRNVWGRCIGYPQETGSVFFRQYIHRCQIKVALPYAAYDHSVDDIKKAKHRQADFAHFVMRTQGMDAAALYAKWKEFSAPHAPDLPAGELSVGSDADEAELKARRDGITTSIPRHAQEVPEPPHADGS